MSENTQFVNVISNHQNVTPTCLLNTHARILHLN